MSTFEQFYDNLDVINAGTPDWQSRVVRSLGSRAHGTLGPMNVILDQAQQLGVKTVVLERDYVDSDFLDEYKTYYARQFRLVSPRCIRLHFFGQFFTKSDLPTIVLAEQDYLGLSLVRPTLSFCTGRSILRSPKQNRDSMYTLCKADFEANVAGNRLNISGMPFIQQDTNVGVCAQAAMWMASLYMHQRFRYPRSRPSEITTAATRSIIVGPARIGLIPLQMLGALRDMGFAPLKFAHTNPEDTARIIYAYAESALPVILLIEMTIMNRIEGHAVVVVGHDFNIRSTVDASSNSNIDWIDRFYVHDDAAGPYQDLMIRSPAAPGLGASYSIEDNARHVIVPVPPGVTMQADDVFHHVKTLMEHINGLINIFGGAKRFKFSVQELARLVFRTYLHPSNDFKLGLSAGMSDVFRHRYRSMRLPRYIWVTEIAYPEGINKSDSGERRIIGEIVIDSTADRHSAMTSYLAMHLLGRMIVRRPDDSMPYGMFLDPNEQAYGHLVR